MIYPKLGIRTSGTEARFCDLFLSTARAAIDARGEFSFYEIGTAEGFTFSALCGLLVREGLAPKVTMVSCDLPDGWSRDDFKLMRGMNASGLPWTAAPELREPKAGAATIYYRDGRALIGELNQRWGFKPDFTFIDGCHGRLCLVADFTAVEPTVASNGLVVCHDAGLEEQHSDYQNHCRETINVRQGLTDLGLMDSSRPGWTYVEQISGDRARGGEGNSHCVFKRT